MDRDDFINTLKKLEVVNGVYKDGNTSIPPKGLCCYVTSNMLCRVKAMKQVTQKVINDHFLSDRVTTPFPSMDKMYLTELHKCPATKIVTLDVDTHDQDCIEKLNTLLHKHDTDLIFIIKTPNGYHYTFVRGKVMRYLNPFIQENKDWISSNTNGMNSIPGCFQGGKKVELIFSKGSGKYNNE